MTEDEIFIELETRKSEQAIRSKQIGDLVNESHDKKIKRSKANVNEFVDVLGLDTIYVSTSGGKDSAVLSDLCKSLYQDIKHIMFNTGLEYQATINLAKKQGAEIIQPSISWVKSCEIHGYPIVSKNVSRRIHDIGNTPIGTCISLFNKIYGISNKWLHLTSNEFVDFPVSDYCCTEFKKKPSKSMKLNPIIGTRIQESTNRKSAWKKSGCNSYSKDYKHGVSRPISLWKNEDIETYIKDNDVELSEIYTQYEAKRTGCKICPYGAQMDGSRFDLLKKLEPKVYDYFINKTKLGYILMISDVDIKSDNEYMERKHKMDEKIQKWHEDHKGKDNYFSYKVGIALKYHSKDKILQAINHLKNVGSISQPEKIIELLNMKG